MAYITIKVDEDVAMEIQEFYDAPTLNNPKNPYLVFQVLTPDSVQVTCYKSKNLFTIVFNGQKEKIFNEAYLFVDNPVVVEDKPASNSKTGFGWEDVMDQFGSDEVGVGDLFGPLVVAACYLDADEIKTVDKLGVLDSKKMTDSKIMELGPKLLKEFRHSIVVCSPKKVSSLHDQGWNLHKIMANLHNVAHQEILKAVPNKNQAILYVDEFASENLYFKYLVTKSPRDRIKMHFKTKGESYYPAVALSSVLARYKFLLSWEEMERELGSLVPKGAGLDADRTLFRLFNSPKKDLVSSNVKTFFRNYQDLL